MTRGRFRDGTGFRDDRNTNGVLDNGFLRHGDSSKVKYETEVEDELMKGCKSRRHHGLLSLRAMRITHFSAKP